VKQRLASRDQRPKWLCTVLWNEGWGFWRKTVRAVDSTDARAQAEAAAREAYPRIKIRRIKVTAKK
jgi:hypothetical protein